MLWEAQFLLSLQSIRTPFLDVVMEFASYLGYQGLFGIALGLVLLIFAKTRRTGFEVLITMAFAFILANLIIKNVVMRPRPYETYEFLQALINKPHDSSFPSGHAVNAFSAAVAIFLNHKKAGIIAILTAALVAFSRLYNCVHYPTDVLAGMVIGAGMAVLVHYLLYPAFDRGFERLRARRKEKS